jgi:hypothetical protein
MTRRAIEKAIRQKPFRRFKVRLTDGELVEVDEEHVAALHPRGKTMIIFEADGGYRIIDISLITELQTA